MNCSLCHRALWADELDRYVCRLCTDRISQDLSALSGKTGLYAQLPAVLAPGAGATGPAVSGSRTAPLPLRIDVLNLMTEAGPVLGPLETWVRDWETLGHADLCEAGTLQQRVDHAVGTLRFNLEWAARHHPAADEFGREIGIIARTCRGVLGGERPPRRVTVACPCGGTMRVTLDTPGARCGGCGEQYGHSEVLQLPMADRAAA